MSTQAITMYGTTWCQDRKRAKKFFGEHRVAYEFVDVDQDAEGLRVVEETNSGRRIIPTIFFPDGSALVEPSNAELSAKLGLQTRPECSFYDLAIVGGGPTGLTAAIYAAREGIDTLVLELNESGFIVTSPTFETSVAGVFAAGDARAGSTKQLVSAAGEGATAAIMIREYLRQIREARSITPDVEREAA